MRLVCLSNIQLSAIIKRGTRTTIKAHVVVPKKKREKIFIPTRWQKICIPFQVPNTRHGGIGLYQCKDGFVLKGQNTTKCDFGNWTGETPSCELIYCPFPGYIDGGKVCGGVTTQYNNSREMFSFQVLLVGNMGLYDYRPYVKKVKNNRQIMFECGRGAKLVDGPPGATCIDGR